MPDTLPVLIDKQDTFEIIRDQIALILFENSVAQQALAVLAAEDPLLWVLEIYTERQDAIEEFLSQPQSAIENLAPVVNIWYESGTFDQSKSNVVGQQLHSAVYNIDVYGFAIAAETAGGQAPGDQEAVFTATRGVRLIRNILMSAQNTYLQMRRIDVGDIAVWSRWVRSLTSFQMELQNESATQAQAIRIAFEVDFNELSPQPEDVTLNLVSVDIFRNSDGKLVAEADFDVS